MIRKIKSLLQDKMLLAGWALIVLSALLYSIPLFASVSSDQYMFFFMAHYGCAIVLAILGLVNRSWKQQEHKLYYRINQLILLLISAYALNREMEIFSVSTTWFSIVLVTTSVCYVISALWQQLPVWARLVLFFSYGLSLVVFTYLAISLLPIYFISLIGLVALGLSIHAFVPLFLVISTIQLAIRQADSRRYWISLFAGVACTVLICVVYSINWNRKVTAINREYSTAMMIGTDDLPLWVQLAQNIEHEPLTEKVLKTGNIYTLPAWGNSWIWNVPSLRLAEEQKQHDPLVVLANLFSPNVLISNEDRVKILESHYNSRHQALERLWSGDDLRTQQVVTNVRVWPAMHLAYTEKTLTVHNAKSRTGWPRQGEAVYTMHMPEGAVVTSLSLWINGKEEKAILTSKEKANTAYRTIVGYERRDPSIVHWQEGNTVSVRVFPVEAGDSRIFKIGFTAPLRREGAQLVYDNIWFQGPDASAADEMVRLEVTGATESWIRQASFRSEDNKVFTRNGKYTPRWALSFQDKGFQTHQFSFNGNSYSIRPYAPQRIPHRFSDVYLDINRNWTTEEVNEVWSLVKDKNVFVFDGEMEQLNEETVDARFRRLQQKQFSLFPFHLVNNRTSALVITKSGSYTPNLADLSGSGLLKSVQQRASTDEKVRLFHIGTSFSPYIRSLKERRHFQFECGDAKLLQQLLANGVFVHDVENDNAVIVHSAEAVIAKQTGEQPSNAPDHLMRLFAYNHIMQQLGSRDPQSIDSTVLVREAQEAYVVSPVSSLVVLESQADYDRFDIKDGDNSLKNASMKNKGAVPEPAEWAIIILIAGVLLFFVYKWKMA